MRPPGIPVIEKILTHLGLQARAPWRQPVARRCKRSDVANPNRSGDPATRAAGAARVREFAGPMTAVWGPVITLEKRPKQDDSRLGRPNPTDHQQITNRSHLSLQAGSSASDAAFRPGSAAFGVQSGRKKGV